MSDKRKRELIAYISTFISGKHKFGTAHKILETIWDVAYMEGYDKATKDLNAG